MTTDGPGKGMFLRTFITYRRHLLDCLLNSHTKHMTGTVADIGGKKEAKRGSFRPPTTDVTKWIYINSDASTQPDILADAINIPLESSSVDCALCCELLEHVREPVQVCQEIQRIVRTGGHIIVSVPFIYPMHADPYDFRRFTPAEIARLFDGSEIVESISMGSPLGTIGMLGELALNRISGGFLSTLARKPLKALCRSMEWLDARRFSTGAATPPITTGFFLILKRK